MVLIPSLWGEEILYPGTPRSYIIKVVRDLLKQAKTRKRYKTDTLIMAYSQFDSVLKAGLAVRV